MPTLSNKPPVKSLKVLGKPFQIRELTEAEAEEMSGFMCLAEQTIGLYTKAPLSFVQDTLLHEAIHAIDESLGLGMTEQQVFQLACGLLALFKDNPQFARWLIKEES